MDKLICASVVFTSVLSLAVKGQEAGGFDGEVRFPAEKAEIWQAETRRWLDAESWWLEFASGHRGKFWGKSAEYPPYAQVNEHDTFLVVTEQGACLMYFFHERWRRAQDVRRWDPRMNEILGCPHVFD